MSPKIHPPFLELQNLLFYSLLGVLDFIYKTQWFLNVSEIHKKTSLRTRLALLFFFTLFYLCPMCFINACKRPFL